MIEVGKRTQREKILAILREADGGWVPLPQILALGVAQYSVRILELRRAGFRIENRIEREDGTCHSWFRLAEGPQGAAPAEPPEPHAQGSGDKDWFQGRRKTGLPLWDRIK